MIRAPAFVKLSRAQNNYVYSDMCVAGNHIGEVDCPLEGLMEQEHPKPQFVMLAGPSGSGKTTFVNQHPELREKIPHLVTPDVFMDRFLHLSTDDAHEQCVLIAKEQKQELIESRQSFMQESILSSDRKVQELSRMKEQGYETTLIYMCLDNPNLNLERVQHRIDNGGNVVPAHVVSRDYEESLQNLSKAILIADETRIYDNTKRDEPHKLLVTVEQGIATEHVERMPGWVERAFPDGVQAHLDAHQARQQEQQAQQEQQSQARQRRRPDLGLG
jgi:predicted ABC-type ATPase